MNGEFVAWEDAKVHVLTHGLHYGTGVFEGIRCYDTELRHRRSSATREHLDRLYKSAELYYMPIPFDARGAAQRDARADRPQRPARPATSARSPSAATGTMGLFPLDAPGRRRDRGLGVGRLPRRGGQAATACAPRSPRWRRISADSLIPHAKASRPVPQLRARQDREPQGRLRGGDPARRPRPRLRGHRARTSSSSATASISTPPQTAAILDGINRTSVIQIARDLGYEVVERDIARAELYLADEVFLTGTAAELTPVREIDDHAIGDRRARARSRARSSVARSRTPLHGRVRALPRSGWTSVQRRASHRRVAATTVTACRHPALRHHPARRHAGRGDVALRRREAARRAPLDELGIAPHRGRLPGLEPQGARAVRAARRARRFDHAEIAAFGMTRRRDVARRRGPGAARAGRLLRAGRARSSARRGALHLEKVVRVDRDENLRDDRRVGRVPRRAGQARRLRRRALLRRLRATTATYALALPARGGRGAAPRRVVLCDTNGGSLPRADRARRRRAWSPALGAGVARRHPLPQRRRAAASPTRSPRVEAGATQVQGTMNGYGERCGNANLVSIIAQPPAQARPSRACRRAAGAAHRGRALRRRAAQPHPDPDQPYVGKQRLRAQGRAARRRRQRRRRRPSSTSTRRSVGNRRELLISELSGKGTVLGARRRRRASSSTTTRPPRVDRARQGARARAATSSRPPTARSSCCCARRPATTSRCSGWSPGA